MNSQPIFTFRWLSPLGISTALFLGYGALNTLVGIVIPALTRKWGTNGWPREVVDLLSMLWLAFGAFQLSVVWFGLHKGQAWALWILAAADLAQLAGWVLYGAQAHDWSAPLFLYAAVFTIPRSCSAGSVCGCEACHGFGHCRCSPGFRQKGAPR